MGGGALETIGAAKEAVEPAKICPVARADLAREVLSGGDFGVAQYGRGYAGLKERSSHDFSNIEFALQYLPVAHDGQRHVFLRDLSSKYLQSRNEVMRAARQNLSEAAAKAFEKGGRIDLVADVVEPIVTGFIKVLSDVDLELSPSLIFDPASSLRKRQMLNVEIGRIVSEMQCQFPDICPDEIGIKLAFAILANDASKGLILSNLVKIFTENLGKDFSKIEWPQQPTESGILFIDRIAKCPVEHGGASYPMGTVFRTEMGTFSQDNDPVSLFGLGRHVCLGRGFFWAFWRDLGAALASLKCHVANIETGLTSNRVFTIPDYVRVEVSS